MTIETTLLSNEFTRIGTFIGWSGQNFEVKGNIKPNVKDLVRAGFYFTGSADIVRCFSCGLEIKAYQTGLDPYIVHITRNPHCGFIMHHNNGITSGYVYTPREFQAAVHNQEPDNPAPSSSSTSSDTLLFTQEGTVKSQSQQSNILNISSVNRSSSRALTRGTHASRRNISPADTSPPRRSSASEYPETSRTIFRPRIQRARSDVAERYYARNSTIVVNQQESNVGFHHQQLQESEAARIKTFISWTGIRVSRAREFAQAGFIYIGPADRVQCVFCCGSLQQWESHDSPLEEHRKYFPQCSFVVESLSAIALPRPKHSKYRSEPSRLSSFQDWDSSWNPKPAVLAKAGFYYTGRADHVRCFFCSGSLCNWEPNDDPWREHARWFPKCHYIKQSKGQAYINGVLNSMNLAEYQATLLDRKRQKDSTREHVKKADDDKVLTCMDSAVVKEVLSLGVPRKLVKRAIRKRLAENCEDFATTEALLETVFGNDIERELGNELETIKSGLRDEDCTVTSSSKNKKHNFSLLEKENRLLKEQKQCKVCLDEEVCVTFTPCGHLVCCSSCSFALKLCPICRTKIRGMIRTYMS